MPNRWFHSGVTVIGTHCHLFFHPCRSLSSPLFVSDEFSISLSTSCNSDCRRKPRRNQFRLQFPSFRTWRPTRRKTRDGSLSVKISVQFWKRVERHSNRGIAASRCGGAKKCSSRAACTSPWRQSCHCGDDSHSAETRTRARDTHEVWSNTLVECEFDPSTCARTRTAKTTSQNEAHHRIALELDGHPHKVTTYQRMSDAEATDARRFLLDITPKRHKTQRSCRLSLFQSFTVLGRPTIRSLSRRFSFSCWCRMNGPRFLAVHTKAMIAEKLTGIKLKDFTRWKIRRDVLLFTRMHWSHHFSTDQISTLALHLLFDFPVSLFNWWFLSASPSCQKSCWDRHVGVDRARTKHLLHV